jgi:hypothetical protein
MLDLDNLGAMKITSTKSKNLLRAKEREMKQKWYGQVMGRLQYLSVAIRPQTIRAMYIKDGANRKKT